MRENSLYLDIPPDEQPSLIPWIIALICAAILIVQISVIAQRIPQTIQQQAQSVIDSFPNAQLSVETNGRSITLAGLVDIDQPTGPLIAQLESITGVTDVHSQIRRIDPAIEAQASAARFAESLASIDFSVVSFERGSVTLTPASDPALSSLLTLLKENPTARVRIEGHTDNTGAASVNRARNRRIDVNVVN